MHEIDIKARVKFDDLLKQLIEELSLLDMIELVKTFDEDWDGRLIAKIRETLIK